MKGLIEQPTADHVSRNEQRIEINRERDNLLTENSESERQRQIQTGEKNAKRLS